MIPASGGGRRLGRRRGFSLNQSAPLAVVVKNLGVAAPVHRSIELPLHFIFGKMLVEDVVKKLIGDGVIRLAFQDAVNLFQDGDMFERSLPKQDLACC